MNYIRHALKPPKYTSVFNALSTDLVTAKSFSGASKKKRHFAPDIVVTCGPKSQIKVLNAPKLTKAPKT
jgi:hypothetical protein